MKPQPLLWDEPEEYRDIVLGIPSPVPCRYCGWKDRIPYARNVGDTCYCCAHWLPFIARRDEPQFIRCRGLHITALPPLAYGLNHYPGEVWRVEMLDGRLFELGNVQVQGAIPAHFRAHLPSNATRLTREKGTANYAWSPSVIVEVDHISH